MEPSLLTLLIVAIVTFLTTTTLFMVLKIRSIKNQVEDQSLYLTKFTFWVGRPTLILLFSFFLVGGIDSLLDLFFLPWPLISILALLLGACLVGSLPIWIVFTIQYIIKIYEETVTPVDNEHPQTNLHKKWVLTTKDIIYRAVCIIAYLIGVIIQITEHYPIPTGNRNIIAVILVGVSLIAYVIILFKIVKSKKLQKE